MTYRARVENGKVVVPVGASLPEGSEVDVDVYRVRVEELPPANESESSDTTAKSSSLYDLFKEFAGTIDGPKDLAENHDHYAHGAPKRQK